MSDPTANGTPPLREQMRRVNGVRLHCVEAGPVGGPPVVLLHGFPEFWFSWRRQIPALAAAGYHVVAPDLRGYNLSEKPEPVSDYRTELLAGDVLALIDVMPGGHAAVAGHDWGGVIAWAAAMWGGSRIDRLVILNAPHPQAYFRELRSSLQLLRSWYTLFFQLPRIPEATVSRNGYAMARELFRSGPCRLSDDPERDVQTYVDALSQPGALTAAINYYRAALRGGLVSLSHKSALVSVPTLLVWGDRDPYLGFGLTRGLDRWVPDLRVRHLPSATHWVQHDEPEVVNELLLEFLQETT